MDCYRILSVISLDFLIFEYCWPCQKIFFKSFLDSLPTVFVSVTFSGLKKNVGNKKKEKKKRHAATKLARSNAQHLLNH